MFLVSVVALLLSGKRAHTIFGLTALYLCYFVYNKDRDEFLTETMTSLFKLFAAACFGIVACMPFVFPILINKKYDAAYNQILILMYKNEKQDRVPAAFSAAWDISAFGFMLQYARRSDRRSVVLDGMEGKETVTAR